MIRAAGNRSNGSSNKLSVKKKASLARDLRALVAEAKSVAAESESEEDQHEKLPVIKENPDLPGASSVLALREDGERGRHVVAEDDIKVLRAHLGICVSSLIIRFRQVGDVLFVEAPYCSVLLPDQVGETKPACGSKQNKFVGIGQLLFPF